LTRQQFGFDVMVASETLGLYWEEAFLEILKSEEIAIFCHLFPKEVYFNGVWEQGLECNDECVLVNMWSFRIVFLKEKMVGIFS